MIATFKASSTKLIISKLLVFIVVIAYWYYERTTVVIVGIIPVLIYVDFYYIVRSVEISEDIIKFNYRFRTKEIERSLIRRVNKPLKFTSREAIILFYKDGRKKHIIPGGSFDKEDIEKIISILNS